MFKRIELPYEMNELEPYMSKEQIDYHYNKHHLSYEIAINNILKNIILPSYIKNLEDLIVNYLKLPKKFHIILRNMGGGLINHNLFFNLLQNPKKQNKLLNKNFLFVINNFFGSFLNLKEKLINKGLEIFGSGWTWLVLNKNNKKLSIINTPNQDNPWMLDLKPIIGIDVWEHAYYIDYRNDRKQYLENIFNILNWDKISNLYFNYINF